jgi:hypothetical protein
LVALVEAPGRAVLSLSLSSSYRSISTFFTIDFPFSLEYYDFGQIKV